ncbi:helix-turn-helix domain-containing protein [Lactobacillus apis]|uniref:helix-turn-helix domain-containing protein n=1 Tax=Lactobacillus apis TaxID=303541 RepID=UPI00242DFE5C|nr:helix-turn-helix transcriptional regulator [Lactobacillus apis]
MNRVEEIRKEQGISREEIAKILGITIESYNDWINREGTDREEKVAIRLGVPKSYLNGNTNYLSQGEREYRNKLKQVAKSELDYIEQDFVTGEFYEERYASSLSVAAQLCTAANLIRVTESIEELSDKVGELNDTINSYGKEMLSRKM